MTRYARAKGSKASNERLPAEDSTPWHVMKQQLIESHQKNQQSSAGTSDKTIVDRKPFVEKKEKTSQWSEFPDTKPVKTQKEEKPLQKSKNKKLKDESHTDNSIKVKKDKFLKTKATEAGEGNEDPKVNKTAKNKNKRKLEEVSVNNEDSKVNKTAKNKNKRKREVSVNNEEPEGPVDKKFKHSPDGNRNFNKNNKQGKFNNNNRNGVNNKSNKKKKFKGDDFKRRKPEKNEEFMNINGEKVEIKYFDRFPVKKEDFIRLRQLRRDMIQKGVPKKDVDLAIKLERRRAEKSLSNDKKKVCFNCRQSGHNISDCPALREGPNAEMAETGICFKCGSTQHVAIQCKVTKGDSFKFATCFICKEVGHISRQCPENTRGIYPHGGCCNLCGDVTHLKINCPQFHAEKEQTRIYAQTMGNDIEALDNESEKVQVEEPKAKELKHVRF